MSFLEDIIDSANRLAVFEELDVDAVSLPASAMRLSDRSVRDALGDVTGLIRQATVLQSVLAGIAASRSSRERGHGGLVQQTGHRNAVELIRGLTSATRSEAIRAVKVGQALVEGRGDGADAADDAAPTFAPWHQPLQDATLAGAITTAQHHAIRAGLGEPPTIDGRGADDVVEAWRAAAAELAREAAGCTVEDLGARARTVRDMLDPAGAGERYQTRFAQRAYRSWTTPDGLRQARITFDDEAGAWADGLIATALAPRRGGPRFVAADEKQAADDLVKDPRTNEQLAYDLFMDVFRAGALAGAKDVYGAREAGVRLVAVKDAVTGDSAHRDAFGRLVATGHSEDGVLVVPGPVLERALCATGIVEVTVDTCGNPLDVGREQRLFTPKQKLALAVRDGGCLWPGCDRPPGYCESHHCDHWEDGGRTDCDRGVLLCRYHHLHLHNAGWRITRDKDGPFLLHAPPGAGGEPLPLRSKSPLRWMWDPPPKRGSWRVAA
ncbi:MAG: DUF222 domain-containing protein [Microbacterium sp.]|uniref:HNH endonuclease signature motif containing protein n=1 Tax=Microbacterium sp. TaxID=51671 RepID=UPI0039E2A1B4